MLGSDTYDAIVLGTGLAESIAAAALAKAGHSVLHLDPNEYYGGEQASLTLDELASWCENRSGSGDPSGQSGSTYTSSQGARYSAASTTGLGSLAADRRRYALTLFPSLMVSRGELVGTLIDSDVSKYVGFRLLDGVSVCQGEEIRRVPGAKEDVFKDKSIPLIDKRRLMKALMFAGGEFEDDELLKGKENDPILAFLSTTFALPPNLATALTYAVAHASSPDEPALKALQRARKYLRSIGRYGPSAFLVGQYGGAGEVAQGFCRACAVFGGTYILGAEAVPSNISVDGDTVTLSIPAHPTPLKARHLIASPDFVPSALRRKITRIETTSHAVVVVTSRPGFLNPDDEEADDTAVLILPPESGPLVKALVMGEGTGSCPANQWVVYLWTTGEDLNPLKEQVAKLEGVAFEGYYVRQAEGWEQAEECDEGQKEQKSPLVLLNPYAGPHLLTEGLDWEAREGRRAFTIVSDRPWFERSTDEDEEDE